MKMNELGRIDSVFNDILKEDQELIKYKEEWGPLASFITDYEHLQHLNGLTQKQIAEKAKTTQSAISRLVRLKGKPSYELLRKVSTAVGGELFISPMKQQSLTLPYDLHERVSELSVLIKEPINDFIISLVRNALDDYILPKSETKVVNDDGVDHNSNSTDGEEGNICASVQVCKR